MTNKRCGFTLIELLVVVLIIGILSAAALPKYQKAVKKARGVEITTVADSLVKSMNVAYLADGTYNRSFYNYSGSFDVSMGADNFDIDIPYLKPKWVGSQEFFWMNGEVGNSSSANIDVYYADKNNNIQFLLQYNLSKGKLSSVTCTGPECKNFFPQYL